jgi:hypothetical protein
MSDPNHGDASGVYELTIIGSIGPVFRSAVKPHAVARSGICTILCARTRPETDLVDLFRLIREKGLSVEGVFAIEP